MEALYTTVDLLGTATFAISGVLVAMKKRLDLFGVLTIAAVTAIGGGTLRDFLIGNTPVGWVQNPRYLVVIVIFAVLAVLFQSRLDYLRRSLFLFDTIGIGLFTMVGIEKGLEAGLSPLICVVLGTMTACFGGVIRDILCNEIPVIFRKEIYATACLAGGFFYFGLKALTLNESYAYFGGIAFIIVLRLLAVRFAIALPNIYRANTNS
jgi:uncharacterized membrane protein YeiH